MGRRPQRTRRNESGSAPFDAGRLPHLAAYSAHPLAGRPADHLRLKIEEQLGWACSVPEHRQRVVLEPVREPVASLEPVAAGA